MTLPRLPLTSILPAPRKIKEKETKEHLQKLNTFLDDYMRQTAKKVNQIVYELGIGAVMKADYNANTILYATTDDTPVALTIAASRIVGRKATGNICAMTAAETRTVLGLDTDDAVTFGSLTVGTLTVAAGSITDTDGSINFGDENLITTGIITGGSLITASDIGIAGDTDLIQLTAANTMQVNGSLGVGLSPSYTIDADEIGHSAGDLKLQPDVQGDVILFGDTDVGDATDGKAFILHRKAAEFDRWFKFYIDKWGSAQFNAQSTLIFDTGSGTIDFYPSAGHDARWFSGCAEGETRDAVFFGYRTGDAKRELRIGVGVDAADTASFDGVSNYLFDGSIIIEAPSANSYKFTNREASTLALEAQSAGLFNSLEFFTKDGDGTDSLFITFYAVGTIPDVGTAAETLMLGYNTAVTQFWLASLASGTGTVRPLSIFTGANTTQLVLNTDGSISMSGALTCASLTLNLTNDISFVDGIGRVVIQSQTPNNTCEVYLMTKDGDGTSNVMLGIFATGAPGDYDPYEALRIYFDAANDRYSITSTSNTTGEAVTSWPIHIFTDANTTQLVLTTDNNVAMSGALTVTGNIDTAGQYEVDGTRVVTNQQAHIADSSTQDLTGTDSVDQTKLESDLANIVAAVNSALSALETHGLLAAA